MLFQTNSFQSLHPNLNQKTLCLYQLLNGRIVSRERSVIYQYQMDSALKRECAIAKVAYQINCLYNKNEQVGMDLTGNSSKNQPRKAMDTNLGTQLLAWLA